MRRADHIGLATLICVLPGTAEASRSRDFDIPAGRLSNALVTLGEQADISIGTTDPQIARIGNRRLRGRFSTAEALRRLLADTGFTFRFIDGQTVQILRGRRPSAAAARPPPPVPAQPADPIELAPIVVTGSKQGTALADYAASVTILDLDTHDGIRRTAHGTSAIVQRLPLLAATSLGPGRNKLFIRGVADSSFNGASQATVGQYLGDVRLAYNAPDPDLNLYDMKRVELLEGPQGTLYGAGPLGGILRLVPNDPNPAKIEARLSAGLITTHHGRDGSDMAGMLNLPVVADLIALRAVGYRTVDPGYIDDSLRGLKDINRTESLGGRLSVRIAPGDGWTIDAGVLDQYIRSRDGQYAERDAPPLTRRSAIAQPFFNDYSLVQFVVRKRWSVMEMVSATGWVHHDINTTFDATGFDGTTRPSVFSEETSISLLSHETRFSGVQWGIRWVAGVSLVDDIERIRRSLGDTAAPTPIAGVRNNVVEAAVFGEMSFELFDSVTATLGGRFAYSEISGRLLTDEGDVPLTGQSPFLPTVALSWKPLSRLLLFVRYQEGFRNARLANDPSSQPNAAILIDSDRIATYEAGMRYGEANRDPLAFGLTLSHARWVDIQADLVDRRGLPYTTNISSGRVHGFEANLNWRPVDGLALEAALFLNDSDLDRPHPDFADADDREFPNIAKAGARAAARYTFPVARDAILTLDTALRYTGESQLGIGTPIDIKQGDYLEANVGARLALGRYAISLDVTNIADVRANRFSLGNPFSVGDRTQITPLRPRSIRIGFDVAF